MGRWRPPRYDVGSGRHLPDPADGAACLCGHRWDDVPSAEEWQRHRFGPAETPAGWLQDGDMVTGLLLAGGAGTRMGTPKALVPGWLPGAVAALLDGGCEQVVVVLGARAEEARPLVPTGTTVVVAEDWADGMSRTLHAGLTALADTEASAALVHLVDLPDVTAAVVRRVLAVGGPPGVLARATYDGRPGHPVLLGRDHWAGILAATGGDQGARGYLAGRDVVAVECGDLATGVDVDAR